MGCHRDIGREHTTEADTEGFFDDNDPASPGECHAHRIGGERSEGSDPDDPDALTSFAPSVRCILHRPEHGTECDHYRLRVLRPVRVEESAAVSAEGFGELGS